MPRPRKYADMIVKSFCVERAVYEALRAILASQGRSLSEEINELLKRHLLELQGLQSLENALDYEALKREHVKLMEESIRLTRLLQKDGTLEVLSQAAKNLGLNMETLDNAEEIAAKLLQAWDGLKPQHTYS